jgi:hypothetical protein
VVGNAGKPAWQRFFSKGTPGGEPKFCPDAARSRGNSEIWLCAYAKGAWVDWHILTCLDLFPLTEYYSFYQSGTIHSTSRRAESS